ncbi:MAG: OmpH family outer membrane protein [Syntrophales bacterium]|jgi:outer membrane protein|nr:OmpH family outer membrane protein [Syntrophales bacterium]NLN60261.1 OmpH family outer membrane protein [Deltaproteobacteria bacterium]
MKRFGVVLACLIISFIFIPSLGAKDFKLGSFDLQKIVRESKNAKAATALLTRDLESKRATLVEKQKDLQNLRADFDKATAGTRKAKQEKLEEAVKEYKRLAADLDEAHKKKTAEVNQKVLQDLRDVITALAKREGYTLIVQKNAVYLIDDEYDITDKVIRLYDQKRFQ